MIDLVIVGLVYMGSRLLKKNKEPTNPKQLPQKQPKSNLGLMRGDETQKEKAHNLKMSGVTMGLSLVRFLFPNPISAFLFLGSYTYTMLPFYRKVEDAIRKRLMEKGEVDSYVLMGLGNVLLLSLDRYFTASTGLALAYVSDNIRAKAKETANEKLASNLFDNLFDAQQKVWVLLDGVEIETTLDRIRQGDVIIINPGEVVPIDGEVLHGMASVDQHAFTGESYPVEKGAGDSVFASTLLLTGRLQVKVEKSGMETAIGKMGDMLMNAKQPKTDIQLRGEQLAESANLPFLGLAGIGFVTAGPMGTAVILGGNTIQGIRTTGPLTTINFQTLASYQQILVKRGEHLEHMSHIDTILFDKTGTLTDGRLMVSEIHASQEPYTERDLLYFAALAEHQLTHPIAQAIMERAKKAGMKLEKLEDIQYRFGFGVSVCYKGRTILVGSARFMRSEGIHLTAETMTLHQKIHQRGNSLVMVAIDRSLAGIIELQATLRPETREVIQLLREHGVKHISIVSGDHYAPTQKLAEVLGSDSFFSEVLPQDKARIVQEFQKEGRKVCFIGDGVNDTLAMQQADLSISLQGSTGLAMDVADIILTDPSLTRIGDLLILSQRLERNIQRTMGICYLGMGIVVAGTFISGIDILTAMGVHFVLGSSVLGNAMLPLLEIQKKPVNQSLSPVTCAQDSMTLPISGPPHTPLKLNT